MNGKHLLVILAGMALVAAIAISTMAAVAGDFSVQTASVTNRATNVALGNTENGLAGAEGSDALFSAHSGTSVILTNCAVWDGSGLPYANTNYTIQVKVGNNDEGVSTYVGSWNTGTTSYYATVSIPSHTGTVYIQTWVYDENTNLYIYPKYEITVVEPLQ